MWVVTNYHHDIVIDAARSNRRTIRENFARSNLSCTARESTRVTLAAASSRRCTSRSTRISRSANDRASSASCWPWAGSLMWSPEDDAHGARPFSRYYRCRQRPPLSPWLHATSEELSFRRMAVRIKDEMEYQRECDQRAIS
jgi:hypothetical protein